jgi:hypothetical protein
MKFCRLSRLVALALLVIAVAPSAARRWEASRMARQVAELAAGPVADSAGQPACPASLPAAPDPALVMRVDGPGGAVVSWQTVGGCGAGAGGGSSIGLKWIGRNVRGGLFNVQEQVTYTKIGAPGYPEYNFFSNTLITRDLGEKWNVGVNLPYVYKYLVDPMHVGGPGVAPVDYSNSGIGDIALLGTRKFGRINDTTLTLLVGLPTGTYREKVGPSQLNQSQQIGFGWPTSNFPTSGLTLDHTFDEVWGLWVVGGSASYRGSKNKASNYRSPSATAYSYFGYFLGPLVPAVGLSTTWYPNHDKDQDVIMRTPLLSFAANLSLEYSVDWIAFLLAASFPYGYDGIKLNESGEPRSPWGFFPWTVSLGIAASPF